MDSIHRIPFPDGKGEIGGSKLTLLGGPCMAESLDICLKTADFLCTLCAELDIQYVFKASFDKANRSSGSSTRGPGMAQGLEYLAAVKERFHVLRRNRQRKSRISCKFRLFCAVRQTF